MLLFLAGLVLRSIPELLVSGYPVGYETIACYAPAIIVFKQSSGNVLLNLLQPGLFLSSYKPLLDTFRAGPLFYLLIWVGSALSGANAFVLLKVVATIFYGCLAVSFFIFVRRGLNIDWKVAFIASLIMIFQPAALRESWDRYRTILALIFLFAALTALRTKSKYKPVLVAALGVLTVLSRDYIGFLFLFTVFGFVLFEKKDRLVSLFALSPSVVLLGIMFNPVYLNWNYLSSNGAFAVPSYLWEVRDSLSIFAVCYLPLLPFVSKGIWRNNLLNPLLGWLLLGSFSAALIPWFAVPGYQRWLLLLVFPFCVYTALCLRRLLLGKYKTKLVAAIILAFMIIGVGYSTGAFSFTGMLPNSYVPVNMIQSSIPWNQIDDVRSVLIWLEKNAGNNSTLLAEERFYGWSLIYLEPPSNNIMVTAYGADSSPEPSLEQAISDGRSQIYLIWYTNSNVQDFQIAYSKGDISIFQYNQTIAEFG